jgi:hypothetical protein
MQQSTSCVADVQFGNSNRGFYRSSVMDLRVFIKYSLKLSLQNRYQFEDGIESITLAPVHLNT